MWGTHHFSKTARGNGRFIPTHVGNTAASRPAGGSISVHPHACGEHLNTLTAFFPLPGSSPRMWGTRSCSTEGSCDRRFIPTHVGNTLKSSEPRRRSSVHPHACGEHLSTAAGFNTSSGSSPRMWGTRVKPDSNAVHLRFIPTHVGNTLSSPY